MADNIVLGVDIGGTGIKAAPVDVQKGELAGERLRILTPNPATPKAVADVVGEVVEHFDWKGPVGAAFPAVVKDGVTLTAANVDKEWIGANAGALFTERLNLPVTVLNDADAAGLAEMRFGAGRDRGGVVIIVTLGTGIGCGLFHDGKLVPNTELGHIEIDGKDAETFASYIRARTRRAVMEEVRHTPRAVPPQARRTHVARPDHHRRRWQQEGGEVLAADQDSP